MNDTHTDKVNNSLSKCHSWFVGTDRVARGCPWSKFFPRKLSYKVDFYQMRFKEKIKDGCKHQCTKTKQNTQE